VFNAANELVANEFAAATVIDASPVGVEADVCDQWNALLEAVEENGDDITTFLDNMGPIR
jgi:hypothetical protein